MKTLKDDFSRDRDAEKALFNQIILNREDLIDKILISLDIDQLSEGDFQYLVDLVISFENNQMKSIQAYHHEKTLNDNYFNGLYE
jgi:hypothetical protein